MIKDFTKSQNPEHSYTVPTPVAPVALNNSYLNSRQLHAEE